MSVDRYTKAVLTVIAVCLVWISIGGPSLITPAEAQMIDQNVTLTGWRDENGFVRRFPLPFSDPEPQGRATRSAGLPTFVR